MARLCPSYGAGETDPDAAQALAQGLARSELAQPPLDLLAQLLPGDAMERLQEAIDTFDFDQALQQLAGALADGDRQRHDLRGVLGNHPALVVWGGKDAIIPASHAEGLEAEVLVLPEAGHMVQMEAAEQVNQQLLAFLRKH